MDTATLVEGGAEGLRQIVRALEKEGVDIRGAYLIKLTSTDYAETILRLVTDDDSRNVIYKFVRLRADGLIPTLEGEVRIDPIRPNNVEASRVLDYASRIGTPTVAIKDVYWDGVFIEDALVVKWVKRDQAVA